MTLSPREREPLRSIHDDIVGNVECPVCGGEGLVCEDHPDKAWQDGDGCCGGAGMPCLCTPYMIKRAKNDA